MAWFKVDDGFWSHPKVIGLSPSAIALWVRAGSYSAQHLTGGEVSFAMVRLLGASEKEALDLVDAGLWDSKPNGYVFHDWDVYQPSSVSTKERRDEISRKRAEAGRKGATARWGKEAGKPNGNLPAAADSTEMAPSRPVPSISTDVDIASEVAEATRPDVERLLDLLDVEIEKNGSKKPKRNKANRDAMRLLLDRDRRTEQEVAGAIKWCQADEFWRSNILSASKLREKYDQMRLHAQRSQRTPAVHDNLARLAEYEAEERASELKELGA